MSGKRMVHESLFASEELSDVDIEARYLYIAMIVHADDAGRMRADPRFLKLKAFPFDNHSVDKVRSWRNQLATNARLIQIYTHDGKEYLFHPKWSKWQTLRKDRMKPTDCPDPADSSPSSDNQVTTNGQPLVAISPPNLTEVNPTKPNLTAIAAALPRDAFNLIWAKYPRKIGKDTAATKFKAQVRRFTDWLDIQKALDGYLAHIAKEKTEEKFIKHGSTWFNNQWRDWINYTENSHAPHGGTSVSEFAAIAKSNREAAKVRASLPEPEPVHAGFRDLPDVPDKA